MGMGGDQLLPHVAGIEKDGDQGKVLADAWSRIFRERYLPCIEPFPGARELIQRIHSEGIAPVAASSDEEALADALLDLVGVRELLADRIGMRKAPNPRRTLSWRPTEKAAAARRRP